jgi:phosphate transport system substrate-binding protein
MVLASLVAALALSFGACKKAEKEGAAETAGVSGTIQVKGSDTLLMLSQRWAEAFMAENPGAVVQVTGGGSGTGIKALIDGSTDVCNASRPMKEEEITEAAGKGVNPLEIRVALDGLAIVVHKDNPVNELTVAQLGEVYVKDGKTKDWKQLGGKPGKIMCYGRQSSSGTYDYFKEHVLAKEDYRPDVQELTGTALLCDAVAKDPHGVAYVGVGYAMKRTDVKILALKKDDKSPAVKPDMTTVTDNSYPLSRYLFNYTDGKPTGATQAFVAFALSPAGQKIVEEVEYVPLPAGVPEVELAKIE